MDVTITKDEYGMMLAWAGGVCLFQFQYRNEERAWYFWMPCHAYDPMIIKGTFPLDYFCDACRANYFIHTGHGITESFTIVKGKNYVGMSRRGKN